MHRAPATFALGLSAGLGQAVPRPWRSRGSQRPDLWKDLWPWRFAFQSRRVVNIARRFPGGRTGLIHRHGTAWSYSTGTEMNRSHKYMTERSKAIWVLPGRILMLGWLRVSWLVGLVLMLSPDDAPPNGFIRGVSFQCNSFLCAGPFCLYTSNHTSSGSIAFAMKVPPWNVFVQVDATAAG